MEVEAVYEPPQLGLHSRFLLLKDEERAMVMLPPCLLPAHCLPLPPLSFFSCSPSPSIRVILCSCTPCLRFATG